MEIVQAQQQQILQQQQQLNQQAAGYVSQLQPGQTPYGGSGNFGQFQSPNTMLPPMTNPRSHHRRSSSNISNDGSNDNHSQNYHQSHSGSNSGSSSGSGSGSNNRSHRRSQSSSTMGSMGSMGNFSMPTSTASGSKNQQHAALGHNRRHSLGLSEAKKAAAQVQAQRSNGSPSSLSNVTTTPTSSSKLNPSQSNSSSPSSAIPSFKFPPSPSGDGEADDEQIISAYNAGNFGHLRSKSTASNTERSPQRSFQFPPKESTQSNQNSLQPPAPGFMGHEKRQSGNFGHKSTNSDVNGNWRKQHNQNPSESSTFVPGHRVRPSYGGSISSLAQFNSNGGPQRKSLFAPYLPQNSLPELINEGRLVTGTLRVNKKNRSDAYVATDGLLDADIFICGSKDRNRALEGDLVAVELLVVDEVWTSKREKEEKKRRKDNVPNSKPSDLNDDLHNDATTSVSTSSNTNSGNGSELDENQKPLNRRGSLKQRPTQKKNDDVEVEGQSLLLVEEEEISDDCKPLYAGHVVAVVDRIPGQLFAGTLGVFRPSQNKEKEDRTITQKPKIVWFKPTDKKVPLIAIPTEQAPKDFVENYEVYADQIFIASIKRWPITSLHPFGTLVSKLGNMSEGEIEVDSILRDNNFLCDEYTSENEEKYLVDLPSIDTELEKNSRRDFSNDYVIAFSQNGTFSDHAIHVKVLSEARIELGVHISDVTYFVKQGSSLDKKSKKRSSSVFLPQKTAHLFPGSINDLASFKEGENGLSLSVVFEIDSTTFEINDVWMGEGVIKPKQRIDYSDVDKILGSAPQGTQGAESSQAQNISSAAVGYITTISLISKGLRGKRLSNSNLGNLPTLTLLDQLDDERVKLSLNIFDDIQSTSIINEIFHTVNSAVAQKVHSVLGDRALLRKLTVPTLTKFENYSKKLKNFGFTLDTSDSVSFHNSILGVKDPVKRHAIETILVKCMNRGKYVIAGKTDPDALAHYLFNLPIYTHFTAPLRRYSDLIVHRQLKAVINKDIESYTEDIDSLKMNSDYCNFKKDCAKAAQDQAIHLLLCQTINEMSKASGQILCMGTVIQVYESSFDIFLPEFGIEKRVHGDQLPLTKAEFDKSSRTLELYWEPGIDAATFIPADENEPLSYRASIKNKYRSSAVDAANVQNKAILESSNLVTDELTEKLAKLNLTAPKLESPLNSAGGKIPASLERSTSSAKQSTSSHPGVEKHNSAPKPFRSDSLSSTSNTSNEGSLAPYLKHCVTRIEGDNSIQEIQELKQIPVLLRSEVGMALPCLTVRTLNPFSNYKKSESS